MVGTEIIKRTIPFFMFFLITLFLSNLVSESVYSTSQIDISFFVLFIIIFLTFTFIFLTLFLIYKLLVDIFKKRIGSRIRAIFVGLFVSISIVSSSIVTFVFFRIMENIENLFTEGGNVSIQLRENINDISSLFSENFEQMNKALLENRNLPGTKSFIYKKGEKINNTTLKALVENIDNANADAGRIIVTLSNQYFLVVFVKNSDFTRFIYKPIDPRIAKVNENLSSLFYSVSRIEFFMRFLLRDLLPLAVVIVNLPSVLLSIVIAYIISHYFSLSIKSLVEGAHQISQGNAGYIVSDKYSFAEIKDLVNEFNKMSLILLEAQYRIRKLERIELWRDVARKISHEIKNPLTPIKLLIQRMIFNQDITNSREKLISMLEVILEEVNRIDKMVNELNSLAKIPLPTKERFDLRKFVEDFILLFSSSDFEIRNEVESVEIFADPRQLKQVLINLVKNAIEASIGKSNVIIIKGHKVNNNVTISVKDFGIGIPEDMKDKILKPYITTKRDGSGLGLSVVETIVVNHGGKLYFESKEGEGSEFFVELPVSTQE